MKRITVGLALLAFAASGFAQIPRMWNDAELKTFEVPLANAAYSPVHASSDDYYKLPVRPVYKSYPIYAPDKEPPGYIEWLQQQEPQIVFDPANLTSESEWISAGELVFDAPILIQPLLGRSVRGPEFYEKTGMPLTPAGVVPFQQYVIRKKGVIEVGEQSCGQCHTRVMPDGSVIKGAQGNFPGPRVQAFALRRRLAQSNDQGAAILALQRRANQAGFGAPWILPNPGTESLGSLEEQIASFEAIPPGVILRQGSSRRYPPQVPDLIGVKERLYLDHTGLARHRSIADMMRYGALNQGGGFLSRYGDFAPAAYVDANAPIGKSRYSDEQLFALSLYLYSLRPPPNPNRFDALAGQGQKVFERSGCPMCHTPPLYTNNKLTPVDGFSVPDEHPGKYDILPISVGTDPGLSLRTRRGTGYYKVPSLKGAWYRGPFEHNGSVATLEDWFDPKRLRDDYVPTGFKGAGVTSRAVKGHPFGLTLSEADRRALIAFLKTL